MSDMFDQLFAQIRTAVRAFEADGRKATEVWLGPQERELFSRWRRLTAASMAPPENIALEPLQDGQAVFDVGTHEEMKVRFLDRDGVQIK